jgi:hypothetical protein
MAKLHDRRPRTSSRSPRRTSIPIRSSRRASSRSPTRPASARASSVTGATSPNGERQPLVRAQRARVARRADPCSAGENFGSRLLARARAVGAHGLGPPRDHQHGLRRHLQEQRAQERPAPRRREQGRPHKALRDRERRPRGEACTVDLLESQTAHPPRAERRRHVPRGRRSRSTACSTASISSATCSELRRHLESTSSPAHEAAASKGPPMSTDEPASPPWCTSTTPRSVTARSVRVMTLSCEDKLKHRRRTSTQFGVAFIEGGWPGQQPEGRRVLRACARSMTWKQRRASPRSASTRRAEHRRRRATRSCKALIDAGTQRVHDLRQDVAHARDRGPAHDARS